MLWNTTFVDGVFVRRINRFTCLVKIAKGNSVKAYLANPGRLTELLKPQAKVFLKYIGGLHKRKTRYELVLVEYNGVLVSVDSRVPNYLIKEAFRNNKIDKFKSYRILTPEFKFGKSRIDFYLKSDNDECLLEVKSCTLVKNKIAMFPDAPTKRGRRHIEELIKFKKQGKRACIIFIVQREDAEKFSPNYETDQEFCDALKVAYNEDVEIYAFKCEVTITKIEIKEEIPVAL